MVYLFLSLDELLLLELDELSSLNLFFRLDCLNPFLLSLSSKMSSSIPGWEGSNSTYPAFVFLNLRLKLSILIKHPNLMQVMVTLPSLMIHLLDS